MRQVVFTVFGTPAPQGSKKAYVIPGTNRANVVDDSAKTKPWREAVKAAALDVMDPVADRLDGAVEVMLTFHLDRPQGHYGTGRNAGVVKESAPAYPAKRPDLDKYVRSTLDALTDVGLVSDDSRIVTLRARKVYAGVMAAHTEVVVREAIA